MSSFQNYLSSLKELQVENTLLKSSRSILLLSGSSHYSHASLTQEQSRFLETFVAYGYQVVPSNFPYNSEFAHRETQFPDLFSASLSNIDYYRHTLWKKEFKAELIRHLQPLLALEDVIIVTQSSGLNMLTQISPLLQHPSLQVFSLGPVSYQKIQIANSCIIKGKNDCYSRILDRHIPDALVPCGHHDYLTNPQVKEVLHANIQKNQDRSGRCSL